MHKLNWFVHFVLPLAIVAGALPAFGAVAFINSTSGGAASTNASVTLPTSGTIDISASNAFFICVSNAGSQSITVSSSPSMGTFLSLTQQVAGSGSMQLWYILNPAVSTTQTVTVAASGSVGAVGMWFSGVGAIDQSNGTTSSPSGSGTWTSASVTPTYNNELIINCTTQQLGAAMSIGSSFIIPTNGQLTHGSHNFQTLGAYLIQTTGAGTPIAPIITWSGAGTDMSGTNATFQAVAANANAVPYIARSHRPVPTLTGLPWHDLFAWLF